jgi:cytochrome o ubiquinol oxidase subunit III
MTQTLTVEQQAHDEAGYSKTILGFWLYLMSDCVLFATLFTTYAVLHNNTNEGASSYQLFNLPYVLNETLILLISSFTCGLGLLAASRGQKIWTMTLFSLTFLLGLLFLGLELNEFNELIQSGNSWQVSAFLSSYFTLVGTHGLHITVGLLWIAVLMVQICFQGLNQVKLKKIMCLSLFWHFLDVIWIFIFTLIYLTGVIK